MSCNFCPQSLHSTSSGRTFSFFKQLSHRPWHLYLYRQNLWLQSPQPPTLVERQINKPKPRFSPELRTLQKSVVANIKSLFPTTATKLDKSAASRLPCPIAVVRSRSKQLVSDNSLKQKGEELKHKYLDIFPPDIPDTKELPSKVLMRIKLRNNVKPMVARAYSCPKRYRDGWKTLIEQHLTAGHICPSSSDYVSPAFIIPKADPNVLPRWVNDYRKLNQNTV